MKLAVLLIFSMFFIGCGSSDKKMETKKEDMKAEATKKVDEVKKTAKTEMKKGMDKMSAAAITCANGGDSRSIEVKKSGSGCEVAYTKFNETKTVASSVNGLQHCSGVLEKMKDNLSSAGFSCK